MTKILDGGSDDGRLNLVLVSEGYRREDMPAFRAHAQTLAKVIRSEPWYRSSLLNVHALEVESNVTASWLRADGRPLDTLFGARYGGSGKLDRVISGNDAEVRNVVSKKYSLQRCDVHIGVLVNSSRHGGNGGYTGMFWTSTGVEWTDTALHEFGHSFAGLCDEYGSSTEESYPYSEPKCPNVTTDKIGQKWQHITSSIFEGGKRYNHGIYRAFKDCRMRSVGAFCRVCQDAIVRELERFYSEPRELSVHDPVTLAESYIEIIFAKDSTRRFIDDSSGCMEAVQWLLKRQFGGQKDVGDEP